MKRSGSINKKKGYSILGILFALVFFTTSSSCSQSLSQTEEEASLSSVEEDSISEEIIKEELESIEEEDVGEDNGTTMEQGAVKPAIILQIMDDYPIYDNNIGICYYRIRAIVSGNPYPEIEFNKDDSGGSWGEDVVRININSVDEEVTLIATATNSAGSASYEMTLAWGCDEVD